MNVQYLHTDGTLLSMLRTAYHATEKRVVLLGQGEELSQDFPQTYAEVIAPCLDRRDAGFAAWPGATDGTLGNLVKPTKNWDALAANAVLNRFVTIRALKEAQDYLTTNASLELPGRRMGTMLLILLRHCQHFKRWLDVDKVLTTGLREAGLAQDSVIAGCDCVKEQTSGKAPEPSPRIILTYSDYFPKDKEAQARHQGAQASWQLFFDSGEAISFPYFSPDVPKLRQLADYAASFALPEDICVYANGDAGMTTQAVQRIIQGVDRGNGVTICAKREVANAGYYSSVKDRKMPGGIEVIAFTPAWWARHRDLMPDMYIGREAWDAVFMHLAEEWADGRALDGICRTELYRTSKAHTDDVCWHVEHPSYWDQNRDDPLNVHNRECAKNFFAARNKQTIWK